MRMIDTQRQAEICQEARFVLWALRCAVAAERGEAGAEAELSLGFDLADVPETAGAFRDFAAVLGRLEWPLTVWHHPRCGCVSTEEMFILRALADTAERQRSGEPGQGQWWRLLLRVDAIAAVDAGAREWLRALARAGVVFPSQSELVECLRPIEGLSEPASVFAAQRSLLRH
jgi:hypothetical protein